MTGNVDVGAELPRFSTRLTRTDLVRYAGASGDFNPIHYSEHFAGKVGLPGVIAHGMLTMATALRVVTDWTGDPTAVTSYFVRFTKPVPVPDDESGAELIIDGVISEVDGDRATIKIEARVVVEPAAEAGSEPVTEKVLGMATAEVDLAKIADRLDPDGGA